MSLELQFIYINLHFTINLIAALVFFAIAWLYFDAWTTQKKPQNTIRWLGFTLLSVSFVAHATLIEQPLFQSHLVRILLPNLVATLSKILGYLTLIFAQLNKPLQPLPSYRTKPTHLILPTSGLTIFTPFLSPILAVATGFLYLRRATAGLEHHLKPIARGFFVLAVYELLTLSSLFRASSNINLANLVAPFGHLWLLEHFILIVAIIILAIWVWGYLIKRLETQLMMIFTSTTLLIFLITTIFFTSTSLNNLKQNTLTNLQINTKVLDYAITIKLQSLLSDAQLIAANPEFIQTLLQNHHPQLNQLMLDFISTKNHASLTLVSPAGQILASTDSPQTVGSSLSHHILINPALTHQSVSAITSTQSSIHPTLSLQAAAAITYQNTPLGAILIDTPIDNAFVDGIKTATGLESTIYAGNTRSATTFVAPDGKSRWLGIKQETPIVLDTVLKHNQPYFGSVNLLNTPYYAAFSPLIDYNHNPIGMIFIGQPQASLLQSASHTIQLTFYVTALLLSLSIIPSFFISRHIIHQIH